MINIYEQINVLYGYLHGMWRYRWSALLIAWLVAMGGWLVVFAMPDQYDVSASLYVDTSSVLKPLLKGLTAESNPEDDIAVMTQLLTGRDSMLSVAHATGMDKNAQTPQSKERIAKNLARSISINNKSSGPGRNYNIYEISYRSTSAELAYDVVSELLNTFVENAQKSGRADTQAAQNFLDEQIAEFEKRLREAEGRLADFKKKNAGAMPDEKGGYYERLQAVNQEIENTKLEIRQAQQRYSNLHKQLSGESPVLGRGGYGQSASAVKLRQYQEQLADMLTRFTSQHPDVQALRKRIADLEANMSTGSTDISSPGDNGKQQFNPVYQELKVQESQANIAVGTLQIRLAELQKSLEKLQQSVDTIPEVEAELSRLNRDYEVTRQRYLSLVERRESARLAEKVESDSSTFSIRVIDSPVVPILPTGPNRLLLLSGVFVAALAAAAGWALMLFFLFPTFVDYKQLRNMIDLPVLGSISLHIGPEEKKRRRAKLITFMLALGVLLGIFGGVMLYRDTGPVLVRAYMNEAGIAL